MPTRAQRTLELLSSELVTNAIVHTRARRPITVATTVHDGRLRMSVTDPDTTLPVVRPRNISRPGGDGLRIIDVLADRWGIDLHPGVGKTVWVETDLHAHGGTALERVQVPPDRSTSVSFRLFPVVSGVLATSTASETASCAIMTAPAKSAPWSAGSVRNR